MSESKPSPEEPEAPRRTFRFKPTEFERTNRPLDGTDDTTAIDARIVNRQANLTPADLRAPKAPVADNEVHAILRSNVAHANEDALNATLLRERPPSRRKRDYWTLLIGCNLLIAGFVMLIDRSIGTLVFAGAGMILLSVALTWIMWFVMDDY